MKEQLRSEAKQLPLMLGKLLGGLMAVIGFGGAVAVLTRRPDPSWGGVWPYASAGVVGLALFLAAARRLARRSGNNDAAESTTKERIKTSALSWMVLLILAALFIAIVLIVAA